MISQISFLCFLSLVVLCPVTAVVRNKNLKRREAALDFLGNPAALYGAPPQPQREYGAPNRMPFREYGPPPVQYGVPKLTNGANFGINLLKPFHGQSHRPASHYGAPIRIPPKQFQQYGPPKPNYGPPSNVYGPPQQLPLVHSGNLFKPLGQLPLSSYGPPASGPLNNGITSIQQIQLPPQQSYGPPPLPIRLPGPSPSLNRVPETTIFVTRPVLHQQQTVVSHDQVPMITACDGWKPIPAPAGHYIEHNSIDTQSGYSHSSTGDITENQVTQYNNGNALNTAAYSVSTGASGNFGGFSDAQLVAIALQHGKPDSHSTLEIPLYPIPPTGPAENFYPDDQQNLNSIDSDSDTAHLSHESNHDSYLKPPADSFAPNSFNHQTSNIEENLLGGSLVPENTYGIPQKQVLPSGNLGIDYGKQSGNLQPWLNKNGAAIPPQKPVAYRPPVPQGLLESIGATVQHVDQFGVKPENQPQNYIPPPSKEIAGGDNTDGQHGVPTSQAQGQEAIYVSEQNRNNFNRPKVSPLLQPPLPNHHLQQQPQQHFVNLQLQQPLNSQQYQQQYRFVHSQALPLTQESRFNQPQDCGHGPNLVDGTGHYNQQHVFSPQTQDAIPAISQSIPIAEHHSQFLSAPSNTYEPPARDREPIGFASQRSTVIAPLKIEVETQVKNLPGLEGLNVLSAHRSQSVQIPNDHLSSSSLTDYSVQLQGAPYSQQDANHKEIFSNGLLRTVLNAINDPARSSSNQLENAQSRSDIHAHEQKNHTDDDSNSDEEQTDDSTQIESREIDNDENKNRSFE